MAMKITQEIREKTITIRLNGELDASSSVMLDEELSKPEIMLFNKILVDCEHLNYISSAGLGVFISHLQRFEDAQIKLIFFNMQEKVKNVFEILGLDLLMTIVSTYDEAMTVANE
jgi:anti-sigma B factor antagonist